MLANTAKTYTRVQHLYIPVKYNRLDLITITFPWSSECDASLERPRKENKQAGAFGSVEEVGKFFAADSET